MSCEQLLHSLFQPCIHAEQKLIASSFMVGDERNACCPPHHSNTTVSRLHTGQTSDQAAL